MSNRPKRQHTIIPTRSPITTSIESVSSATSSTSESLVQDGTTKLGPSHVQTSMSLRSQHAPVPENSSMARSSTPNRRPLRLEKDTNEYVIPWIHENYERKSNSNVPRSGMYEHYCYYCSSKNIRSVNAATFGKLVRMAFPDIATRRLGNRGQSKYQYCHIQRKEFQMDDTGTTDTHLNEQPEYDSTMTLATTAAATTLSQMEPSNITGYTGAPGFSSYRLTDPSLSTNSNDLFSDSTIPHSPRLVSSSMSNFDSHSAPSVLLPDAPTERSNSNQQDNENLGVNNLCAQFADQYNQHCQLLFTTICAGEFEKLDSIYKNYYQNMPDNYRSLLHNHPKLVESIWRWDCVLYDSLIIGLLPRVDMPLSEGMITGIRHYIETLPNYLNLLLQDFPTKVRKNKVEVTRLFTCKLLRQLTLNQFATAVADILRQPNLLETMKSDWENLDMDSIFDHLLWICDCRKQDMEQILQKDITHLLIVGTTLNQWMTWEEKLVDNFVPRLPMIDRVQDMVTYMTQAKQFMLKWKVYTGSLIQQLDMEEARTIGSFRSLQIFLDDLVLYDVEERIAAMNANVNKCLGPERANNPLPVSSSSSLTPGQTN
ncbi:RFX DNA-binding domain-containing protein [Chlamydoabsidia padenii]|nr:RFX DNA-binding domain-containing protein [Chlamydoabsidia padenii]